MLTWINKKRNKKGFTLVELVVVIAILGILAMIAIPRLSKSRDTAKIATHNANVRILKSIATMYIADHPDAVSEDLTVEKLQPYFDGKDGYPKVPDVPNAKPILDSSKEYVVTLEEGNIVVTPGEATIDNKKDDPDTP